MYGKVHYLAPEQAQGRSLDQRADIFSTGATLYELLTAHSAFSAASKYLVLLRISQGDPDPITRHLPDIDSEVETIVDKSMAYSPEIRYQSADALRTALDNVLANRGVTQTARDLAKFVHDVFGDAADAASLSPAARRRSTQPLSRRESISRPEDTRVSSPPWRYLMIGIGVGAIAGVVWVLKLVGAL
jgi:serine/threonine protein kinase